MFCSSCGANLEKGAKYCRQCGADAVVNAGDTQLSPQYNSQVPAGIRVDNSLLKGSGVAALVLGIGGGVTGLIEIIPKYLSWWKTCQIYRVEGMLSQLTTAQNIKTLCGLAMFFALMGLIGGLLPLRSRKVAGILMLASAIGWIISVSLISNIINAQPYSMLNIVAFLLLLVGGILALISPAVKKTEQN